VVVCLLIIGFVFFFLFVVYMRCPSQGATGAWVMAGLVFK